MLIGLCGKSGTGKSTICDEIVKLGYKKVITDTTRPPRKGEKDGVDYFFDTDEQFQEYLDMGEFIETTSYKVASGAIWKYGTTIGQLNDAGKKSIIILNPDGVKAFRKQNRPINIFLIYSTDDVILSRLKARGDKENEIKRRMAADEKDFANIEPDVDYIIFNNKDSDIKQLAEEIVGLTEIDEGD